MSISSTQFPLSFGSPGLTNVENQVKGLIEATEANIERLTAQIRELNCMRDRERSILATLRLMVVPIGKLPTELLVEIFKFAVHTPLFYNNTSLYRHNPSASMFNGPAHIAFRKVLCLSQVSPYWRQIVNSTPQLWAEGVVDVHWSDKELTEKRQDRLKTLLARSAPSPLSISIQSSNTTRANSISTSIARIILPTAHRWRNLHINLDFFPNFNNLPPGTFNALERLTIEDFDGQLALTVFQSSPRLRNLILGTMYGMELDIHLLPMPWSQLTELTIDNDSLGACRAILLQCSNLVSARFLTSYEWDFPIAAAESPVVVLPFLKTLVMTFYGSPDDEIDGVEAFFIPLSLPSLKTLDFKFDPDEEETWPTDVFSEFQVRSPNIEHIHLLFSSIDPEGLITLLRPWSALTTLHIENSWNCVNDTLLHALRYDDADPAPLVPKLQELSLKNIGKDYEEDTLEDVIRSRWGEDKCTASGVAPPRVARLQKAMVCTEVGEYMLSEGFKARMQELAVQGLELHLV
ncbi:hypothetical protein C8R44DRAFT_975775 [Mycena epipterygia]|nr:hypothetical protein C8R44DRAFT_975775 [Mycena epipterygia]